MLVARLKIEAGISITTKRDMQIMDISLCQVRLQTRFVIQTNLYVLPFKETEKLSTRHIYLFIIILLFFFLKFSCKASFSSKQITQCNTGKTVL